MKLKNMQALELLKFMSWLISTLFATDIQKGSPVVNAMIKASEIGNVEFVVEMINFNPALLWLSAQSSIFHVAAEHRQERIWNLIYALGPQKSEVVMDSDFNTLLHKVSRLAPENWLKNIPGPLMQMQWELQWFKEVETVLPTFVKIFSNHESKTPQALFTEEHKDLLKDAEKWIKDTSSSCMVVTTRIATVMFAAAITVRGGNDSQKGIPMFLPQMSFTVFIAADAISLFSSITSILMFLSIFTSRFAIEDFLKSLPKRLIIGFATLYFSIATMMVAFSATLVIVLSDRYKWIAIPVALLASFRITLFQLLQFPIFVDMVLSTYGSSMFRSPTELLFINSNPAQSVWSPTDLLDNPLDESMEI